MDESEKIRGNGGWMKTELGFATKNRLVGKIMIQSMKLKNVIRQAIALYYLSADSTVKI